MDCSLPGSSVHWILQARILDRVAIFFSRGSLQPRNWTLVSCILGGFSTDQITREAIYIYIYVVLCLVTQSCLTLCDPIGYSPSGSSVHRDSPGKNTRVGCHSRGSSHGISQGSSQPRDQTHVSYIGGGVFTIWDTREACIYVYICMYIHIQFTKKINVEWESKEGVNDFDLEFLERWSCQLRWGGNG